MTFTGTTPEEAKTVLRDIVSGTAVKDIYIGCSGNFSVDKIMSKEGYRVHSNDVSLYSKLIADIVIGNETEVEVKNPLLSPIFSKWQDTKYKKLIEVMFAMQLSGFAAQKNDYQREMFSAVIEQADTYYQNAVNKLQKGALDFTIHEFFFGDFVDFLKRKDPDSIGISFPPTYKGGYEKMFQYIEDSFEYERASYSLFDPGKSADVFGELLSSGRNIIYADRYFDELSKYMAAKIILGPGKHPIFFYSSVKSDKKYYIEREKHVNPSKFKVISEDYEFSMNSKITVLPCNVSDVNYYKAFYMSNRVNYTTGGDLGLVFLADGKAFGFASLSKRLSNESQVFVQSDFVVASQEKRLSKLLIMLLKSSDTRKIICRKLFHYYDGLKTSVYTDKPVSMKYRSVFELERRDKNKLIYKANFQNKTVNEIFLEWIRKTKK